MPGRRQGVTSGSNPGERRRRSHTRRLPSETRSTLANAQPEKSARMASMVAAADRDTLASIRSGWYSYSSVAGRQLPAVGAL